MVGSTPAARAALLLALVAWARCVAGDSSGDVCTSGPIARGAVGAAALRCGVPCTSVPLSVQDSCRFNVSSCAGGVQAGSACEVACKAPYVGTPVLATCPLDNVDARRAPDWTPPDCDIPGKQCLEPADPPVGYEKGRDDAWRCGPAYAGTLRETCIPDDTCTSHLHLSGCELMQRCSIPEVDPCKVDVRDCEGGVWPGGSCTVRCKAPYAGSTTAAMCYPDNTRAVRDLLLVVPECELQCADPPQVQVPPGYERDSTGGWRCASGFGGNASWQCAIDQACAPRKELMGCRPLQPCALPVVEDACRYDFAACANLAPGASCPVRCRSPYVGEASSAHCPAGNTDPTQPLVWTAPTCQVACTEVAPLPVGYVSYPYRMTPLGWSCVEGFAGGISIACTTNAHCNPTMEMTGCRPMIPCVPPSLTPEEFCMYDMLTCVQVPSGLGCDVGCRAPYYIGSSVRAECPANNTDPTRQLEWIWPVCTLQCPELEVAPEGYRKLGVDSWACATGYIGVASSRCVVGSDCVARIELDGCQKLYPCVLPPMASDPDSCLFDWSDCVDLPTGQECELRCKAPYTGNSTTASCPDLNILPDTELIWTAPDCDITCQVPQNVPGYELRDWECDEGYAGRAEYRCTTPNADCRPEVVVTGCVREQPCRPPSLPADPCMFNASDCSSVSPGSSCELRCEEPYVGRPTLAFCPEGNADPNQELFWTEPSCELPCPDPNPVPPGYAFSRDCGWHCAPGWAGRASKTCSVRPADCGVSVEMSGCTMMVPCAPLQINSTCKLDASGCGSLLPGEECNVTCAAAYTQGSHEIVRVMCPHGNTDPTQPPVWPSGMTEDSVPCDITCFRPNVPPAGYQLNETSDDYDCTSNYTGQAQVTCEGIDIGGNCLPELFFEGCLPIVPCNVPTLDPCQFDFSACGDSILPGQACDVQCHSPYILSPGYSPGRVSCPLQNSDRSFHVLEKPVCDVGCLEPTAQDGYFFHTIAGQWMCATDYIGRTVRKQCVVDSGCIVRPVLSGCTPLAPCKALELTGDDVCRYDVSDCTSVMAGLRCTIRCRWPLLGYYTRATCDSTNTDPTASLVYSFPQCDCRPPDPVPTGYAVDRFNDYSCAPGYHGTASTTCTLTGPPCDSHLRLSGCDKIEPCPVTDVASNEVSCRYQTTNCSTMDAGETCTVGCAAPYTGNATQARCPATNTDATRPPDILPRCGLKCPDPVLSAGYRKSTGWRCTAGYQGVAKAFCANTTNCGSELQLSGCAPWTPCVVPAVADDVARCQLDFSDCRSVSPGSYCQVRCKYPFVGQANRAFCPPNNVDPKRELVWAPPKCHMSWPEPSPWPEGYVKSPVCGWQCAPLYYGPAVAKGAVDGSCNPYLHLSGCFRTSPCRANYDSVDHCRIDASDCFVGDTNAGFSCVVNCKAPYVGAPATVHCPEDNVQLGRDLAWVEPDCNFDCQDPDPVPDGYTKTGNFSWECSPGYVGTASAQCWSDEACQNPTYNLSGCIKMHPCVPLVAADPCRLNVSGCSAVQPGSSCQVGCMDPYVGEPTIAACPEGNTDPARSLSWQEPRCFLNCTDDPDPMPQGYARVDGEWRCSEDAIGAAVADCSIDSSCVDLLTLSGCRLLQPCLVPAVDECTVNVTDCLGIRPGETCTGSCKAPFVGPEFNASCPADNTDPAYQVSWSSPPACDCPDPSPAPPGYVRLPDRWSCAENHIGTARLECTVGADCAPQPRLTGCVPLVACAPPNISYMGNRSQCQSIFAGESCRAECISTPCIGGGPVEFRCPALNTDGATLPEHVSGSCEVRCEVCEAGAFIDMDPQPDMIAGILRFGPAQAQGSTFLPDIDGYRVHFAGACGTSLGVAVPFVPRRPFGLECCLTDAYAVTLEELPVPPGATQLMVTVVTSFGELPHGKGILLQDRTARTGTMGITTVASLASSCPKASPMPRPLLLAAALVGVASLLS